MPAKKKDPSTRARRNRTPGAATLPARQLSVVPDPVDYAEQTVPSLKAIIDERNADGRPEELRLAKRGSKATLVAALEQDDARRDGPPELPTRLEDWTEQTRKWWDDVWSSPMAKVWDESDIHNVHICALLYDDMWTADTAKARKEAAGEFRLQCARLGLDPYARRRLEWQIEAAAEAQEKGQHRRTRTPQQQGGTGKKGKSKPADPRAGLSAVN